MSNYTGTPSFLGFGEEVTWGTGVAATKWVGMLSESLHLETPPIISPGLRGSASRMRYRLGPKRVMGDISVEVPYEGFGTLLYHLLGAESTANVAGNVYDHTITPANALPTGLSFEVNRGGNAATSAFRYVGCLLNSMSLSSATGETVNATFGVLGKDEETPTLSPAAASSPTLDDVDPFVYHEVAVKVDVYGGSPAEIEALGFTLDINNNLKEDKEKLNSRLRAAIPRNGHRTVNGSFRMEFDDFTEYDRFVAGTEMAIQIVITSASVIESTYYYTITIDLPRCIYTGTTPQVGGPELIEMDVPFEAFYDNTGSNPEVTITVRDSDTSI